MDLDDILLGGDGAPSSSETNEVPAAAPAATADADDDLSDALANAMDDYYGKGKEQHQNGDDDEDGNNNNKAVSSSSAGVPTLADGRPVTSLTKKQAKAELDKKEYKAWKKAMKSLGAGGDSDDEGAEEEARHDKKKEKKDKSDKKEKKDRKKDKKKDKKSGKKHGRDSDNESGDDEGENFAAELEGLAGDADALDKAKRSRREKHKAKQVKMDVDGGNGEEEYDAYAAVAAAASGSSSNRRAAAGSSKANGGAAAKKMSKEQRESHLCEEANALVEKMANARRGDMAILAKQRAVGTTNKANAIAPKPPINRLVIKDEVLSFARKADNEGPLVKAGFLREIAFWILDPASNDLAPLDLRNVAYDLLLRYAFKGSMATTHPNFQPDLEDLNGYQGIGRAELAATTLGKAVNTSRQHASETPQNRQRAVTLLQRLSRAFSAGDDSDDEGGAEAGAGRGRRGSGGKAGKSGGSGGGPSAVRWPCMGNDAVLSPYDYVANATEVFQSKVVQVDPLDPESYVRVPPLRIRKTPIR